MADIDARTTQFVEAFLLFLLAALVAWGILAPQ
jgi:hypothetical protein